MPKRVIHAPQLMLPIAHFSHAVRVRELLHVGATAGTDAQRRLAGSSPGLVDVAAQTVSMFDNMETVLGMLGGKASELVRIKLYVSDARDMARCRSICDERYGASGLQPVIVGSADFPLPQAAVELDAVALVGAQPAHAQVPGAVARYSPQRAWVVVQAMADTLARSLREGVEAAGMAIADLVNLHVTVADLRDLGAVEQALATVLREPYPSCAVVVAALGDPTMQVQVEAQCIRGGGVPVTVPGSRCALACASPATLAGDELHIGAQTGVADAALPGDVQAQTRQALGTIDALLAKAGMGMANLLRTNNMLIDWRDYAGFNAGYGSRAVAPYPPRATMLGVLATPGARVQVEGVAHRDTDAFVVLDRPPA